MALESLLVILLVGAVAGWLAGLIVKGYGFGLLGNIVVGIVGAFVAGLILPTLGLNIGSGIDSLLNFKLQTCGNFDLKRGELVFPDIKMLARLPGRPTSFA